MPTDRDETIPIPDAPFPAEPAAVGEEQGADPVTPTPPKKPAVKKPAVKKADPVAAAAPLPAVGDLPKRKWRCSVPADRTLPAHTVEAVTAGDAEREYKRWCGIISTPHPIAADEVADGGDGE